MEDFLGFVLISFLIEVTFWGIFYVTGKILTPIISFGRWRPSEITKNSEGKREKKLKSGYSLRNENSTTILGEKSVCLLGLVFWALILIIFLVV